MNTLSQVQSNRQRGGKIFEDFVALAFDEIKSPLREFNKTSKWARVGLKETDLTFDVDGLVEGEDGTIHLIEVKKSISDSTVCKIYCQYMAYFHNILTDFPKWTFTVIVEEMTKTNKRHLKKLSKLPNFRYTSWTELDKLNWK